MCQGAWEGVVALHNFLNTIDMLLSHLPAHPPPLSPTTHTPRQDSRQGLKVQ
jgi:hypothetical protein